MFMDMDRKLVSKEPHEISYLAEKLGVSPETIRQAHKQVGRSRAKVEAFVKAQKATAEAALETPPTEPTRGFDHHWVSSLNYSVDVR
jgi:hypothetical protein